MQGAGGKASVGHDPKSDEDSGKIFIDFIMLEVRSLESEKYPGKENKTRDLKRIFCYLFDYCMKL